MSGFSPESASRIPTPPEMGEGLYVFSDNQEPPTFVKVWYEASEEEVQPGHAVSVLADGPYTQAQLSRDVASYDDSVLSSLTEEVRIQEGALPVEYTISLRTDPRQYGKVAAEGGALLAARHVFAMAGIQ